jgi:hypothetical protein
MACACAARGPPAASPATRSLDGHAQRSRCLRPRGYDPTTLTGETANRSLAIQDASTSANASAPLVRPTPSPRRISIAVASDIHASAALTHKDQTYATTAARDSSQFNALAALRDLVERDDTVRADYLLCPGDLTNRIDVPGMRYAWESLTEIAELLAARRVIATTGNHDVIRGEDLPADADERAWVQALRELDPPFPDPGGDGSDMFFAVDFTVIREPLVQVVVLNSCARHGAKGEYTHGSISDKTRYDIEAILGDTSRPLNIVLCHHHPIRWRHLAPNDTSEMTGGDQLLAMLEGRPDASEWLVLHGHRHVPALGYHGESTSGPVRFSAGSLAVNLHAEARGHARNQFYIFDFDLDELDRLELQGGGRFRAWDFNFGVGMAPASDGSDLPSHGGFGFRRTRHELAKLAYGARPDGLRKVTWAQLVAAEPGWEYVAPSDIRQLRRLLLAKGHSVTPDDLNAPTIQSISFAAA